VYDHAVMLLTFDLMEYITLHLDSTNEVEQSYYIGDMFRPIYRSSSGLLLQISPCF